MEIILQVNGKSRTFSERQLTSILEKHFANETVGRHSNHIWGKSFWISPMLINRYPFYIEREDELEEILRQRIVSAFEDLDTDSKFIQYSEQEFTVKVVKPQVNYEMKENVTLHSLEELLIIAGELGDYIASETEQALEWAQRIDNGESWQNVISNLYVGGNGHRLVRSKDGVFRVYTNLLYEPQIIADNTLTSALPLVVSY